MTKNLPEKIYQLCREIKTRRPLIHVVTNFVVMNQTANALLALGASPTMSWAREDTAHMSQISDALCINIGTPVVDRIEVMEALMLQAQESGKPVVLDPVGSGAGPYRTGIAKQLSALAPHKIIRANPSEICSLTNAPMADETTAPRGVDSRLSVEQAKKIMVDHGRTHQEGDAPGAESAALLKNARAIVISGHTDWVMGTAQTCAIANGDEIMGRVTGTGCILSALITAFYAVTDNAFDAAVAGVSVAGIAGEMAAQKSNGPGFFMNHFMDSLYHLSPEDIERRLNATLSVPAKDT